MAKNFSNKSPISNMVIVQDIEFEDTSLINKEENINKQNNSVILKSKEIISLKLKNCDLDKKESFNQVQKSSIVCDKKNNLINMNEININKIEEIKDFNQKTLDQNLIDKDLITCEQLSIFLNENSGTNILIDNRSFIEYNSCHIQEAINVCCSKIIKRRLQNDKTSIRELLNNMNIGIDIDNASIIVVYDQNSDNVNNLPEDGCLKVLWTKLNCTFKNVKLLKGGFNEFHKSYKSLCTNKAQLLQSRQKKLSLDTLSQPCLPNLGPTKILPFLYLGSQVDAMNKDLLKNHNITYELNVSTTCPKPDFIKESNFLRIPVNDNYSDKLLPYFPQAINFLDKVRESSGCVLVHCLGGISRSATVAIAYIMQHMKMTSEDAYRYLKGKRATISPNFNFLGQLLEYEKQLIDSRIISSKKNLNENNSSKTKDRQDSLEKDNCLQPTSTPSFDLNKKTLSSSSPKHHLLHHRFNSHLINLSNQEKNLNDSGQETFSINSLTDTTVDVATNNSSSHFNIINSSTGNGSQKRTCSFNSSPNTRNKMTLKLPVNEKCDNLNSIVFM